jgi:hypothetical protein
MKLYDYVGLRIRIIDDDGNITTGLADFYTSELDDPDGAASLSIRPDGTLGVLFEFEENEIAHIEIIDATFGQPEDMPAKAAIPV